MKFIAFIVAMQLAAVAFAQDVPEAVSAGFEKKYRDAEDLEWEQSENGYEGSFYQAGTYKTALFNKAGQWLHTASLMDGDDLPDVVIDAVYEQHPASLIEDVAEVETPNGMHYALNIFNSRKRFQLEVSPEGKILRSSRVNADASDLDTDDDEEEDDDW